MNKTFISKFKSNKKKLDNKNEDNFNFLLKAKYFTNFPNEIVYFINKLYDKFIEVIIINSTLTINSFFHIIPKPGLHEALISIKLEQLYSIDYFFSGISNLVFIDFYNISENNNFQTMKGVFKDCQNLRNINFNKFSFRKIIDLSLLFANCESLTNFYPPLHLTEKTTNISYMFANCSSLKSIDFTNFNIMNVKDMSGFLYGCSHLTSVDFKNFKSINNINMEYLCAGCSSLESINLEYLKTNKLENLNYAFINCSNLKSVKLPYFDKKLKTNFDNIFFGCNQLLKENIKTIEKNSTYLNDVCVVGLWYGCNYGSMLTYYALHEIIKKMGYSILMIDDPLEPNNINYSEIHPKYMVSSFYRISQKKNLDNLVELNKECKSFIVGSDQLWNINLSRNLKQFYFLGFADDKSKKISFATSFGIPYEASEEEKNITEKNLRRFDGISVRDLLSLNILKNNFNIKNAVEVCDPTLLCNISDYYRLINKAQIKFYEEYLLAYVLDPNPEIGNRLEELSIILKIKVIILLDFLPDIWEDNKRKLSLSGNGNLKIKNIVNINEWLWFFNNSNAVFTDSYHGTIFSIIFKKPFITLVNKKRGEERFYSLLKPLKLMHRLFKTPDCLRKYYFLLQNINYTIHLKLLSKIKNDSYNWLKTKLSILLN